ncbi:MAG: NAD(P)/FAD-dependent oxidoreductase [Spirochaetales bacterium]|uniref:NAD(P)/FAD-dependent oxidoreductase n=1 Tax=Candidatus Thalassospirochaeta sargassi TaxID=3119039 RepID=A0AAJ1IDP9_9SPIO|nr:NAD(P)/FAD-dependent oxidoreductase [Spirochaetales bacterium]
MYHADVIVIGAGPAGLFAAAELAKAGFKTLLVEGGGSAGKKLLISGQGKCNITNETPVNEFIKHYGSTSATRFVRKSLYAFSNTDLIDYFASAGLKLKPREDGKVFPASQSAAEVLNLLLNLCRNSDARLYFDCKINRIEKIDSGFRVYSAGSCGADGFEAESKNILISTGGFTYPTTGSDGSGYSLAEKLGHSIIPPKASLTGIIADRAEYRNFTACAGITADCSVSLFRYTSKQDEYTGRLLFTHKGMSGPVIIDNSRNLNPGDEIRINLLCDRSFDQASADFLEFCANHGKSGVKQFFIRAGIPERLTAAVFASSGASASTNSKIAEISSNDRKKLIAAFTSLKFGIASLEGRNRAMCTAGGIDKTEINPATMESRIIPGLYFAGEVIDVDGDSGGFNLQFAFSSAHAVALSIRNSL